MEPKNLEPEQWKQDYREFIEATRRFYNKTLDTKTYKGISGGFGSYAQRGGNASMLRLRLPGGRLEKDKLAFVAGCIETYGIDLVHFTTCQTVQLHNLNEKTVCRIALEALEHGIITRGGGGDFPRNVMVSPLSGVEKEEYFDVMPYSLAVSDYLLSRIHGPMLPRKLKVAFSNSAENLTHATFRDLGFAARPDGLFDVYSAGGLGINPSFGIKVADGVEPEQILYYVKAMYDLYLEYGNYENRAKARSRFIPEALGGEERYREVFREMLESALTCGENLRMNPRCVLVSKEGRIPAPDHPRVIEQKQKGLYSVLYHPVGGSPKPSFFREIYNVIRDMEQVELRLTPGGAVYIINCDGREAAGVLKVTEGGAETAFEASAACIGASVCQQGIGDSQALLKKLVQASREAQFADGILPQIHISGCPSSCGTHQIGELGFQGCIIRIEKAAVPAWQLSINGCERQGSERMGEKLGVIPDEKAPDFILALGKAVEASGKGFIRWQRDNPGALKVVAEKFLV